MKKSILNFICVAMLVLASCSSIDSDAKKLAKLQNRVYQLKEQQQRIAGNAVSDVFDLLSGSKKVEDTKTAKLIKEVKKLTEELAEFKTKLEQKYSAEELEQLYKLANEKSTIVAGKQNVNTPAFQSLYSPSTDEINANLRYVYEYFAKSGISVTFDFGKNSELVFIVSNDNKFDCKITIVFRTEDNKWSEVEATLKPKEQDKQIDPKVNKNYPVNAWSVKKILQVK
jgi:predicted RND superfamily exporter protein